MSKVIKTLLYRARKSEDGNTAIEFAIVAPVLFIMLIGIIEFGLIMFGSTVMESAVNQSIRQGSLGTTYTDNGCGITTDDRTAFIRQLINCRTAGLMNPDDIVIYTNVLGGTNRPQAEMCTTNPPSPCPCTGKSGFYDDNNNGICDTGAAPVLSPGGPNAIVRYRVIYPWSLFTPLASNFIGRNGVFNISSTAVVKNEPF